VASTNRDLGQMVAEGRFREELYYRLRVFEVLLPPLRERREDIALLAAYFTEGMAAHLNKPVGGLDATAEAALLTYDWPGNVRELEHTVRRAVVVCQDNFIRTGNLALKSISTQDSREQDDKLLTPEAYERFYLEKMLEKADWIIKGPTGVAAQMGVPVSTLRYRMKKLGIKRA
jgi:transcriptional regulator with GAF, ATPase, and Fis domain